MTVLLDKERKKEKSTIMCEGNTAVAEKQTETEWFVRNPEKKIGIVAMGKHFNRYPVRTHYVRVGQDTYIDLIRKYILPVWRNGDILSISEKVISLCEGNVVYKKDVKVSGLARMLSKHVHYDPIAGLHLAIPEKMQVAIDEVGVPRILLAACCAAFTRPFGKHGVFYQVAGRQAAGIDGFESDGFKDYNDMAILCPENSDEICADILQKTGVRAMIVDANDFGVEILGAAKTIPYTLDEMQSLIRDNPACQEDECTPFVIIREEEDEPAAPSAT
jgi:hypothetical protein